MANPFDQAKKQISSASKLLKLDSETTAKLMIPDNFHSFWVRIRLDNGRRARFRGFRSQYNNALGPYKGGIRFHPEETADTVLALSAWMTWKCSLAGIPYGGGKGGIICNPKELSKSELKRLSKEYSRKISKFIVVDRDIPAPDVYTNPQIMSWMLEAYEQKMNISSPGTFTGKPIELGGHTGRTESTGLGVAINVREAAKKLKLNMKSTKIVIQGFGNVGQYAAKHLDKMGAKIIAISDSSGGLYDSKGLDISKLIQYKQEGNSLSKYKNYSKINNEKLLTLKCDVLIPSALENAIDKYNADKIDTKIIVEGANGPITTDADKILFEKSIIVVPDILANSGGVIGSYFEWLMNRSGESWELKTYNAKLDKMLTDSFSRVYKKYNELKNIDMRKTSYMIAIERVVKAMELRGR